MARLINILALIELLLLCTLITQSWCICLPAQYEQNATQLADSAIISQQRQRLQQQKPQQVPQHATAATAHERTHHKSYDKNDDVADDWLLAVAQAAWPSDDLVANATAAEEAVAAEKEKELKPTKVLTRNRRALSDWLIAPNTHWCGRGNTANGTYNHLGGASTADKCCRKHDHCQMYIPAMSNRYELFNYRPYTLSHCHCDRRFRTCLKMANDEDANTIGKLFFNMVQTQCFVLKQEKVCQKRAEDGNCEQEFVKQKAYLKSNKRF